MHIPALPHLLIHTKVLDAQGLMTPQWFLSLQEALRKREGHGTLAEIPTRLGSDDEGYLYEVEDYKHVLRWTGSAWEFAPGDPGSGFLQHFAVAPGSEWKLCDGTATTYLKSDGTTASITPPDLQTGQYLKGGAYTGTPNAAGTVTLTGNTDTESAHTHAIDHDHGSFTSGIESGVIGGLQSGGGFSAAAINHTHAADTPGFTGTSGAGSAHAHGLTGVTTGFSADPVTNLAVPVYFRR